MYENTLYQFSKILPASKRGCAQILYCQKRADMTPKKIKLGGSFKMICKELEIPFFFFFFA